MCTCNFTKEPSIALKLYNSRESRVVGTPEVLYLICLSWNVICISLTHGLLHADSAMKTSYDRSPLLYIYIYIYIYIFFFPPPSTLCRIVINQ